MTSEEFDKLLLPEKYIISKCHALVASVTEDLENYQLGAAGSKIYEFMWDQYADWYIEISKTRLYEGAGGTNPEEAQAARRINGLGIAVATHKRKSGGGGLGKAKHQARKAEFAGTSKGESFGETGWSRGITAH